MGIREHKKYFIIIFSIILGFPLFSYFKSESGRTNKIINVQTRDIHFLEKKYIPPTEEVANYRYLVYECTGWCTGWGNRLNGVFTAYYLAILSNRAFRIQMKLPCHLDNFLTPNRVLWNKKYPKVEKSYEKFIAHMNYTEIKDLYDSIMSDDIKVVSYKHYTDRNLAFLAQQKQFRERFLQLGYSSEELENFHLYAIPHKYNIFDTLFTLNTDLREEAEKVIDNKKLMCAHIRLAETGERAKSHHIKLRNLTGHVWDFFSDMMQKPEYDDHYLYVASDSSRVIDEYIRFFPNRTVKTRGSLTNIQRWAKDGERPSSAEACDGFRRVILDWVVLTECRFLLRVPAGSTFSETAVTKNRYKNCMTFPLKYNRFGKEDFVVNRHRKLFKNHPFAKCNFQESSETRVCF